MSALQKVKDFVNNNTPVIFGGFPSEQRSLNYISDPLGNPKNTLSDFVDYELGTSGGSINARTALSLSTVYACVKIIAEDLSTCDIHVERKIDGHWRADESHYLNDLFQTPSQRKTLQNIRESYIGNAALTGNGITHLIRDSRTGRVVEMVSRDYSEVFLFETVDKDRQWYYVTDGQGRTELLGDADVVHLKNFSLDGRKGLSPITYHGQSISVGLNAVDYAQDNFSSGGFGGGFIETAGSMTPDSRLRFSKQVRQAQAMGLPPVLVEGTTFTPNKISPKDVELVETLRWSQENIASTYRMPLHMLQVSGSASGANLEQQGLSYVTNCLRPWARKEEDELERKLLTTKERKDTRIRVDLSSLSRGDMAATSNYLSAMIASRIMTPNEARHEVGLPSVAWGDDPVDNQKSSAEMNGTPSIHTLKNSDEEE